MHNTVNSNLYLSAFRSQESEEIYETLRGMRGTPISYIVNQTPIQVAVGGKDYPIGCGLSYLVMVFLRMQGWKLDSILTTYQIWLMFLNLMLGILSDTILHFFIFDIARSTCILCAATFFVRQTSVEGICLFPLTKGGMFISSPISCRSFSIKNPLSTISPSPSCR